MLLHPNRKSPETLGELKDTGILHTVHCHCVRGQGRESSERSLNYVCSRRNSIWANAALVVTVGPSDWAHLESEHGPLAAMQLQVAAERCAHSKGRSHCPSSLGYSCHYCAILRHVEVWVISKSVIIQGSCN